MQPSQSNPAMRFLSIGECMVEMAPSDRPGEFRMGFAGDSWNTAWYLRALCPEIETRYYTRVGSDAVSDAMLKMMADAGVDISSIGRSETRSVGLYLISLQEGERSFSYWRDGSAARQLADDPAPLQAAMDRADLIYISGITLGILPETGRATLIEALRTARAAGKRIAFDPNLRPRLWQSPAEMTAAVMDAARVSDIVLPSFEDEADYFGDADTRATAQRYLEAGASTVIVKNGAGPIHYVEGGTEGTLTPPPAHRIVDTTSAGDSFNAGLFAGLSRSLPLPDSIRAAAAVAGQVIGHKGALAPLDLSAIAL